MHLESISTIRATIKLLSGLHIGAGNDTVEIGGLDQPIIKNPLTGAPYIPGSSIKGKMRSLLETAIFINKNPDTRKAVNEGKPCGCGKRSCPVCVLFGAHNAKTEEEIGPTRMLVRDAYLCQKDLDSFKSGQWNTEIKYENIIHRVKGTAEHPRPLERVPAGVSFDLNVALKIYEGDAPDLKDWIFKGLKLIELDALGGCSSRGCGQVQFEEVVIDDTPVKLSDYQVF